jgi:hypothetical protein
MKAKVILACSLVANLAFLTLLLLQIGTDKSKMSVSGMEPTSSLRPPGSDSDKTTAASNEKLNPKLWSHIYTEDRDQFAANLLAAGVPRRLVQVLIWDALTQETTAKRRLLQGPPSKNRFLPSYASTSRQARDREMQNQSLWREQIAKYNKIFPDEDSPMGSYDPRWENSGLSPEKTKAMMRISKDYAELSSQVQTESQGVLLPDDQEKFNALEKEKRADIEALLSPEELRDYDMRNSPSAMRVRNRIGSSDISEADYMKLYQLQEAFDKRFEQAGGQNAARPVGFSKEREEAEKALDETIKAALGADRYEEIRLNRDYAYTSALNLTDRFHLPNENAKQAVQIKNDANKAIRELQTNGAWTEQSIQRLNEIKAQTKARLEPLLTVSGAEYYMKRHGENLNTTVTITPAKPPKK